MAFDSAAESSDRIATIPNLLSALRLVGVPIYLWFLIGPHWDVAALAIIAFSGLSDYLDGKIARWLDQTSRLGIVLDPAADRLYVLATLIGFAVRDLVPWWLAALLILRDLALTPTIPALRRRGYGLLQVHYLGKAATFNLMYGFPLLLLAHVLGGTASEVLRAPAWAFVIWGTGLYLWAGALYVWQTVGIARAEPRSAD
ncbi:MAG: CDP-alcohol phosphatidyltransferase family protein [Mycobacteriales bacterium]